jgi:hypothetical protein
MYGRAAAKHSLAFSAGAAAPVCWRAQGIAFQYHDKGLGCGGRVSGLERMGK